jgi:hypothetical protein
MRRKAVAKLLDNESFSGAVGGRNKVELALILDLDTPLGVLGEQRSGFTGDFYSNG